MKDKCKKCPDRFRPDGYICENECPYDDEGNLKIKKIKRLKIYIAHRYAADNVLDVLSNIGRAVKLGSKLAKLNHFPFVPHLDCLIAIDDDKKEIPLSFYYENSLEWLKVSDAIFIMDLEDLKTSKGVKLEYDYAVQHNMPIFYSLDEVPNTQGSLLSE